MSFSISPDEYSEFVRSRRSIRSFKPDPIPSEILNRILDDAKWAPSWTNTQPYFLAIASGETTKRLAKEYLQLFDDSLPAQHGSKWAMVKMYLTGKGKPSWDYRTTIPYPEVLTPYRRKTGADLYALLGIDRKDRKARDAAWRRNFEFFGAPTVIFVFVHDGLKQFAAQDAGFMEQTLMLSALANGLGTCAQGAIATWAGPVRKEFDIPEGYKFITAISVGYPDDHIVNTFNAGRREIDRQEKSF
jgi:nitroreductase